MDRRLRMLCLVFVAAGAMLPITYAAAAGVPFEVHVEGWAVVGGPSIPGHLPVLDISCVQEVDPNPFGIVQEVAFFRLNAVTRACSEGQVAFITGGGDVLYARLPEGQLYPDPQAPNDPNRFQSVMDLEFVGGTGPFAGARGSATSIARHGHVTPVKVTVEDAVIAGTLSLADLQSKMVAMRTMEGELVSLVVEPEAFPLIFQEVTHTGDATHCGEYVNSKRSLLDFSVFPIQFCGFFTKTADNGDVMEGYYEGDLVPSTESEGAFEVAMELWITGGTGHFENASGHETGSGLVWLDGREDIVLEGTMSSLGSSK